MNVLTITGILGDDCRINSSGNSQVCNFSIATTSGYGEKKQTNWIDCSIWGKKAESALPDYLVKRQKVCVSGELGTRTYNEKTYLTLRVNEITLLGDKSNQISATQSNNQVKTEVTKNEDFHLDEDDIPF